MTRDWSDHALWWPEKRRWLTHTRSTLDQIGITANCNLEFTPQHKLAKYVFKFGACSCRKFCDVGKNSC